MLALVQAAIALLPYGALDCPCIDPHPVVLPNGSACPGLLQDESGNCYSADYGSRGCRPYDEVTDACLAAPKPDWCSDRWCYVLPWDCLRPHYVSSYFEGATIGNTTLLADSGCSSADSTCDAAVMYSYETCGNIDEFSYETLLQDEMASIASRGPLRITFVGDNAPWQVTVGDDETDTDFVAGTARRDGTFPRFVTSVLDEYGIAWRELPISVESLAENDNSTFAGCIHDVALNATDLCVGSTWAFEYRRRLAPFTATLATSDLRLVVRRTATSAPQLDVLSLLQQPFEPFTKQMWLGLVSVLVYMAYALYTLDASGYESDDENEDADEALAEVLARKRGAASRPEASSGPRELVRGHSLEGKKLARALKLTHTLKKRVKFEQNPLHMLCPTTRDDVNDLFWALANTAHAFLGMEFRFSPSSGVSWLVLLGLSFLCLVINANYIANVTASSVISASRLAQVTTIEEGIEHGYHFCGWGALKEVIEATIPGMTGRYVSVNGNDALAEMDAGACDAAIIEENTWRKATADSSGHCAGKFLLPQHVYTVDIALAVRGDLERPLSMAMIKAKEAGEWAAHDAAARARFLPQATCGEEDDDGEVQVVSRVGIQTGAGVLIIACLVATAAMLLNMLWYATPSARAQGEEQREWLAQYRRARTEARRGRRIRKPRAENKAATPTHGPPDLRAHVHVSSHVASAGGGCAQEGVSMEHEVRIEA